MEKKSLFIKFISVIVLTVIGFPLIIFLCSGNFKWIEGWIFSAWIVIMGLPILLYLYFKDPALWAEKASSHASDNPKKWDQIVMKILNFLALIWFLIMPLDAERLKWSPEFR